MFYANYFFFFVDKIEKMVIFACGVFISPGCLISSSDKISCLKVLLFNTLNLRQLDGLINYVVLIPIAAVEIKPYI